MRTAASQARNPSSRQPDLGRPSMRAPAVVPRYLATTRASAVRLIPTIVMRENKITPHSNRRRDRTRRLPCEPASRPAGGAAPTSREARPRYR